MLKISDFTGDLGQSSLRFESVYAVPSSFYSIISGLSIVQNNYRKINLFSFKNIKSDLDLNPEILKKLISGLIKIQKCATVYKIQKYATVYKIQKYATVYKIHKYATVYKIQKDASIYKIQKDATVYKIQKYATVYKIMPDVALGIDVSSFQNR